MVIYSFRHIFKHQPHEAYTQKYIHPELNAINYNISMTIQQWDFLGIIHNVN